MKTTTKANFAKTCGVSRQAIDKQCKAGAIGLTTQGKREVINLDHRLTKEYIRLKTTEAVAVIPVTVKKKPTPPKPTPESIEITAPIVTPKYDDDHPDLRINSIMDIDESNLRYIDKKDLEKYKLYEQTLSERLKREEKKGLLVPRTMVHQVFSKLYTVDTNELRTMEDRLVPKLCGVFGFRDDATETVQARKMITDEVAKAMKHIQRIMNDYLTKIGTEKI